MEKQELLSSLHSNYLFRGLSKEQLQEILSISKTITLPQNTYVVREGEMTDEIYLLIKGKVEVLKKDEKTGRFHQIAVLNEGEWIGELALIDQSPRSASVRTLEDSELLVISNSSDLKAHSQIMHNILGNLTKRLRTTNEVTVKALEAELHGAQIRNEMGRFLFQMLVILSVWIIIFGIIKHYSIGKYTTSIVSTPMILILFGICVLQIKNSLFPISFYGVNANHWKRNVVEAILFSVPVMVIALIAKALLIQYVPFLKEEPLINFSLVDPKSLLSPFLQRLVIVAYVLLVPLQEFVARGAIQSALSAFLVSRSPFWSIVLSSLLFAAFHSQVSSVFAMVAFIAGCFWGCIYFRQKSLLGPTVSHAIVGLFVLGFLGFGTILTKL